MWQFLLPNTYFCMCNVGMKSLINIITMHFIFHFYFIQWCMP